MLIDFRFKAIDLVRDSINLGLRPLEYVMQLPRNLITASDTYFTTRSTLANENIELKQRQMELTLLANQSELLRVENQNLRQLLSLHTEVAYKTMSI